MERAGSERLAWNGPFQGVPIQIDVEAEAFANGQPIPVRHTGDGDNVSPGLRWINCPKGTRSLTILCEDPDAPMPDPFVHWLAYNVPCDCRALPEHVTTEPVVNFPVPMMQGKNSMLKNGYTGPMPPKGDEPHRYVFQLYALDIVLPLEGGEGRSAVLAAMRGHVIAKGMTIGTFAR